MKRDEKKPTASQVDSYMLISGDELRAANAVCARLTTAADDAVDFVTATAKGGFNPAILSAPSLQALTVLWSDEKEDLSKGRKTRLSLAKLASVIADMRIALTAAYRGGDPAKLLSYWLSFVYRGAIPLLQKKHSIALAEGNRAAAQTFAAVFNGLPPRDKIDHPNGWADIEAEARRLAQSTTPDEIFSAISRAFRQDAEATDEINAAHKNTSDKPIGPDLNPEQSKKDALEYMARLVCYVWCKIPTHNSKTKAMDYVFQCAKDGDSLFSDCSRARLLLKSYKYNPSTVQLEAAKFHSRLTSWRQKTCLEWPDNWRDMGKKSKENEIKQSRSTKRKRKP